MKRVTAVLLAVALCAVLCSCLAAQEFVLPHEITVVSREDGSGTRSAFVTLLGLMSETDSGAQWDNTTLEAQITNNTAVMIATVAGDPYAVGYISMGSLSAQTTALSIDGVAPTPAAVADGSYPLSRPFLLVLPAEPDAATADFLTYLSSTAAAAVIENAGFVPAAPTGDYSAGALSGRIVVSGSSSVAPVMEKLKEAYETLNPNVNIEIQMSDSTTGVTSVSEGICDLGMSSRALSAAELASVGSVQTLALDGIAVIVNELNPLRQLSSAQLRDIYSGALSDWSEVCDVEN